ncbi:MAG: acyl-ACP--UDP-N-acetylglucosamine O-acyltransferase [Acidobacteria bacterium]|nr:acyl-ACP--UDP-N-acetylglucosamine O-acyltransferase [Acidobacteriota bacterium]MCB9398132.1 acyl-ACP--UDP-N-acetylglucosamine O-acyltransferase [Acidobacteriota bacterium]
MTAKIHPTAIIGERVELGKDVEVGPYCIVESDVHIGAGSILQSFVTIGQFTKIGEGNRFFPHACIGMPPQDLKFKGEETHTEIGNFNHFRESTTVHRGTAHGGGLTKIGDQNLFMVGAHVAHDCFVGNRNVFANSGTLAGHVKVGDCTTVGAFSAVHQFCRVGDYAFIGGFSVITQDALPYVKSVGNRAKIYGINAIGLQRQGFSEEEINDLRNAYRTLFHKKLRLVEALDSLRAEYKDKPKVDYLINFIAESERGIIR